MKHKKVKFLRDHISPQSGNSHYKAGQTATFRDTASDWLVDNGHAEYADKPKPTPEPAPEPAPMPLTVVNGVGDELAGVLKNRGFVHVVDLAIASVNDLIPIPGIGAKKAEAIIKSARQNLNVISVVKT